MKDFITILKYVIPYKTYAILNIVFNLLSTLFSLFSFVMIIPFLGILFGTQPLVTEALPFALNSETLEHNFNFLISNIIVNNSKSYALFVMGLLVVVATALKTITLYFANHFMVPLRNNIMRDLRNNMFHTVVGLPISYFSEEQKGNIIARMTNDVQEIEWGIMCSLEMLFRDPIKIVAFLIAMLMLSWKLTIFVFILLPLVGLIIGTVGHNLRKASLEGQRQMGNLMSQIDEMLGGLRIIKAFNGEGHIFERFKSTNGRYTKLMNHIARKRMLAGPLSELLATIAIVAVMWYGGFMILGNTGTLSSQELIGYLVIFSQIIVPAKSLSTAWYNVKKAMASVDRVNSILKARNPIVEKQGAVAIHQFTDSIEFRNVSFAYNKDMPVLRNIDLRICKGQTVALVGKSGAGKSTFADLIPRFYDLEEGEILIDGRNIKDYRLADLRSLMGYVNQVPILFNDSIYNNIVFGKTDISDERVVAAAKVANAHDFIMESEHGYDTNIGDGGCKLSGGQRQRLSIARAVLKNPPILILDEATSALDTQSEKTVQNAIDNLMHERTSIVIAHRLSTIKNADMICVMNNGQIIEIGKHQELLNKKGEYYKLYQMQNF